MSEPSSNPTLWHLHCRAMEGFYQSEVVVCAMNHQDAVRICGDAVVDNLKKRLLDYYFARVWDEQAGSYIELDDNTMTVDEIETALEQCRAVIVREAGLKMVQMDQPFITFYAS